MLSAREIKPGSAKLALSMKISSSDGIFSVNSATIGSDSKPKLALGIASIRRISVSVRGTVSLKISSSAGIISAGSGIIGAESEIDCSTRIELANANNRGDGLPPCLRSPASTASRLVVKSTKASLAMSKARSG